VILTFQLHASGFGNFPVSVVVPLESDGSPLWFVHPTTYPRVDVAVIPLDIDAAYRMAFPPEPGRAMSMALRVEIAGGGMAEPQPIQALAPPDDVLARWNSQLDVADELYIAGYPKGITDRTMQPLWKRATVASNPTHGWNRQPCIIVDAASRQGMSGAPVLAYFKNGKVVTGGQTLFLGKPIAILAGIYVGRLDASSELEAQLGVVWTTQVVDDILRSKILAPGAFDAVANERTIEQVIADATAAYASDSPNRPMFENEGLRRSLVADIMEKLGGRANPRDILRRLTPTGTDEAG
jgi:hypothetical protein